jgi:hypothetical protein
MNGVKRLVVLSLKVQCHEICTFFKGTVSRDRYFFNILISTFYVCATGFQDLLKAFHYPIPLLTFYLLI